MTKANIQEQVDALLQSIRQLVQEEEQSGIRSQLNESITSMNEGQLSDYMQHQNTASFELGKIHDSCRQLINEIDESDHPKKSFLLEHLQSVHRRSGEVLQQDAINATTGQALSNDPYLRTPQVIASLRRLEDHSYDELKHLEKQVSMIFQEL